MIVKFIDPPSISSINTVCVIYFEVQVHIVLNC